MHTVNIALVGVGNCTASLVQGLQYYTNGTPGRSGLTNPMCAGYAVSDVRVTAAFDVNVSKVGKDLSEAIWASPNNALKFADVPHLEVQVHDGVLSDGIGCHCAGRIDASGVSTLDEIAAHLQATNTHIVVSFLPVGAQDASELYAEAAIRARCAFVNCMPATIARSSVWEGKFKNAGLPLLGDDLKSQFGSTLIHHALINVLLRNGVDLKATYQIVSGGNMDFLNLQDSERVKSKKASKIQGLGGTELSDDSVHFGAEFVPFLKDRKVAFIRVEGEGFGGTPVEVEVRMAVEDSPSAAGNTLDAVRYLKAALDRKLGGVIDPVAALFMKAPPRPMSESDALSALDTLIKITMSS